jgi:hypothetical protein
MEHEGSKLLTLAYLFEFMGVFLLAVEAIKSDNLAHLRTGFRKLQLIINPPPITSTSRLWFYSVIAAHVIVGGLIFTWISHVIGLNFYILYYEQLFLSMSSNESLQPLFKTLSALMVAGTWMGVGQLTFFMVLVLLLEFGVWLENWVQRNTANGIVGIVGFLSYCIYIGMKITIGQH